MKIRAALAAALLSAALIAGPALANGVGFFDDEEEGSGPHGTPYFGFVKTEQGKAIPGVAVVIKVKGQDEYKAETTTLGLYKSTDIPRDVDPKAVEVTVSKAGFVEAKRTNRSPKATAGTPVQIDFVLKTADQKAQAQ